MLDIQKKGVATMKKLVKTIQLTTQESQLS